MIIPLHIYCQSTVKRADSHLPAVPPVNLCLCGERVSKQKMEALSPLLSREQSQGLLLTSTVLSLLETAATQQSARQWMAGWRIGMMGNGKFVIEPSREDREVGLNQEETKCNQINNDL